MQRSSIEEYYIEIAEVVAKRSTCKRAQVGALVVKDGIILSTGYNGAPSGMPHCIDTDCILVNNHCINAIHAEINAILKAGLDARCCSLFTTHLPCIECCKVIINARIKEVFYLHDYVDDRCELIGIESQILYLSFAGILVTQVRKKGTTHGIHY